jgi:hypothetical protein
MLASVHSDFRSVAPVCLSNGNPNRLVSLLDMYQIAADQLVFVGRVLQALQSNPTAIISPQARVEDGPLAQLLQQLESIKRNCDLLNLNCTSDLLSWMLADYRAKAYTHGQVKSGIELLSVTFEQELRRRLFAYVEPEYAQYFRSMEEFITRPPFGDKVMWSFPATIRDMGLAGNSYAYGLPDACVFHLMRVLEKGLSVLAGIFSEPFAHENWHNIIERIESKIRKMDSSWGQDWKEKQQFYSEVATQFMFFKEAWRNHVMHGRSEYDSERAKSIYDHVCSFMQRIAECGLKEPQQ